MSFLALLWLAAAPDAGTIDAGTAAEPPVLDEIRKGAKAYAPIAKAKWVKQFLTEMAALPHQPPVTVFCSPDKEKKECFATAGEKPGLVARELTEDFYYGRIADGLGYARAFDVLADKGFAPKGKRVLDFGYGNISQLEALVKLGATVAGIEVDPTLPLLYAKANRPALRIHHGFFPNDAKLNAALKGPFDLFISKNTLKKGYIHPERELTPEWQARLIKLGATDDELTSRVHGLLAPGGLFFIYNICPPETPPDQPFVPWTDCRSPFTRETYEKAGFEVLAFDIDDTAGTREMAAAYAWEGGQTYVAKYTLLKKKK